ncbi:MAG: putative Ig domain-containing protein [Myxococcales bacterium]|jgi:hypothetical protein
MKVTRLYPLVVSALFLAGCHSETSLPESKVAEAPGTLEESQTSGDACRNDRDCGPERRCCGGECSYVECCDSEECQGRICTEGRCEPCDSAEDCGAGKVCCAGLCQEGGCCSDADCGQGQVCLANNCQGCSYDGECAEGQKCCDGACVTGSCCSSADCGGALCEGNQCVACTDDAQCGEGQECCEGACVAQGACLLLADMSPRATCTPACGGKTPLCCNGACIAGQCCTNADCQGFPSTPNCINYVCQRCTSDAQCGSGKKCCNGACVAGECCPGQVCANGQACFNNSCSQCSKDNDCGAGYRCCNGSCVKGNCCTSGDCAGGAQLCIGGTCAACSYDVQCGKGKRCCGGACIPLTACCSNADCSNGQVCSLATRTCVACQNDAQCPGGRCCGGKCTKASCCSTAECQATYPGSICGPGGTCQPCAGDSDCGGKGKCCGGRCLDGATCCKDSDCGAGLQCINGGCGACQTDPNNANDIRGTCPRGQVCCPGSDGKKSCRPGTCCDTGDCAAKGSQPSLVCAGNFCGACDDSDPARRCPDGMKCCNGVCTQGSCCDHEDCGCGAKRCVDGVCTVCEDDDDCGGGMQCCPSVDDASKTKVCKAFCETTKQYETAEEFDSGTYSGTQEGTYYPGEVDCGNAGFVCVMPNVNEGTWSAVYDSQILPISSAQPFWKGLNVRAKIPASAVIEARVRVSKDTTFATPSSSKGWSDWLFLVPKGNSFADYSLDLSYVPKVNEASLRRYIEVQLRMKKTVDRTKTPVVQRVQVVWSPDDPLGQCTPCPSGSYRCGAGSCCLCKTCESEGLSCGSLDTRCKQTLNCGSCPNVANGFNVCSQETGSCELLCHPGYHKVGNCCAADNCETLGKNCGNWHDGCNKILNCGATSSCPQPANSTRFCNNGVCDFTCHDCYVKSGNQCLRFTETFTVKVVNSTPSVYVAPAGVATNKLYYTPTPISAQASTSGHSGGGMTVPITYSLVNAPAWLRIDSGTGAISGSPYDNRSHPGTYTVTVRATTRCGSIASTSLTITVLANKWCGDGVISADHGEICDTAPRVCYSDYIQGLPTYCTGAAQTQGEEACINECKGWGVCSAPQPDTVSGTAEDCYYTNSFVSGYFCCAITSCSPDDCGCCGRSGYSAPTPTGYESKATATPCSWLPSNTSCRVNRSTSNPRDWAMTTNHTTVRYQCWR